MHVIRNVLSTQQRNIEILDKVKKGQTSTKQLMKEYKVSKCTIKRIKRNADKIKKLMKQEINLTRKRVNEAKSEQLQDSSYKCYRKRIKPGDFSKPLFKAKEIEREFGGPSTIDGEKQLLGNLKPFKREKQQESTNYKSRNSSENSQSLVQETNKTEQELDAEKFIQKFNHQLEEENIRRDNIYTMIKISFKLEPYFQCTHQAKNKIHVEKLLNDRLFIIFCTNATGSYKLSPFYIYEYEDIEAKKFLKNKEGVVFTSKENMPKNDKIFANWYNNNFMKLVKKHQKETNASGKVLLLVKKSKTFILPEDAMQNDNFEILFFPFGTSQIVQPLKLLNMKQKIRQKFEIFHYFCTCYDIGLFISKICELWANISSAHIESVWKKLLKSDSLIEENATSLVEQMSELDKNVTEEDTVSRKSSASRDEKLDFLFSKVIQDCSSVSRKTENTTSTCIVKQKSKLTESELEEHNIALEETPTEVDKNIQFLFSKLLRFCPSETGIAMSTWTVEQTSKLIKNVTGEDTALKETSTEIETEIKEPQQNTVSVKNIIFPKASSF